MSSGAELGPLVSLTCCCCGGGLWGRQWWNRDTGYGLCNGCIADCNVASVPVGGRSDCYGVRGVHWDAVEKKSTNEVEPIS